MRCGIAAVIITFCTLFEILLFGVSFVPSAEASQEPSIVQESDLTIRVEVGLVTLTATVGDRSGRPIPTLEKDDFVIYEDGVRQDMAFFRKEDDPVSVGILFDTSGSMVDKIDEVKDAVIHFIETINSQDDIFLMQFSTEAFVVQDFTDDRQRLLRAIGRLRGRGSTSLYEAIVRGLAYVQGGRHKKKALLVITDGNDTSSEIGLEQAIALAQRAEVLIYCLGIGHGERGSFGHREGVFRDTVDVDALLAFTDVTGGKAFLLQGAHFKQGVDQIDQACQQVAAELRQQYTLGYYPNNKKRDGTYRRIQVEVKNRDFTVRSREGYFASPPPETSRPQP